MWNQLMCKIVAALDPKFDKYRKKIPAPKFSPKNLSDFIDVIRRTPRDVLNSKDRIRISAIMSFDDRKVSDLMVPKSAMVFVGENDFLGPLTLDKLYKSGFTHFPVTDIRNHVKGVIHTESLNALEIKTTDKASKYLDKKVFYLHETDTLNFAVSEILRTDCCYFFVLNKNEELAGFFTLEMVFTFLLGDNL